RSTPWNRVDTWNRLSRARTHDRPGTGPGLPAGSMSSKVQERAVFSLFDRNTPGGPTAGAVWVPVVLYTRVAVAADMRDWPAMNCHRPGPSFVRFTGVTASVTMGNPDTGRLAPVGSRISTPSGSSTGGSMK